VPPPGDTATPRASVDVEPTPPSFAGGSRIFDIENPEALARDVGAADGADGAARPSLSGLTRAAFRHCQVLRLDDVTLHI